AGALGVAIPLCGQYPPPGEIAGGAGRGPPGSSGCGRRSSGTERGFATWDRAPRPRACWGPSASSPFQSPCVAAAAGTRQSLLRGGNDGSELGAALSKRGGRPEGWCSCREPLEIARSNRAGATSAKVAACPLRGSVLTRTSTSTWGCEVTSAND